MPLQPPSEDLAYDAVLQLGLLNHRLNLLAHEEESRQLSLPNITLGNLVNRIPCTCDTGLCKCCAGESKMTKYNLMFYVIAISM